MAQKPQPQRTSLSISVIHFLFLLLSVAPARALIIREFHLEPRGVSRSVSQTYVRRQEPSQSSSSSTISFPSITPSSVSAFQSESSTSFPSNISESSTTSQTFTPFFSPTPSSTSRQTSSSQSSFIDAINVTPLPSRTGDVVASTPDVSNIPSPASESSTAPPSQTIPAIIGGVVGGVTVTVVFVCILLYRRRSRGREDVEKTTIVRPFGSEAGFHVLVDTDSNPTAVNPFLSAASSPLRLSTNISSKSSQPLFTSGLLMPSKISGSPSSSLSSSDLTSPSSAVSQQGLLEELNALRTQIRQLEAFARNGSSGDNHDGIEPPPEYDASPRNDVSHAIVRREKGG